MPKFIDYHAKLPQLPPQATEQMAAQIKGGKTDQFGAKGLNVFFGKTGQAYCLTEAPNVDAVVKSHQALGVPLNHSDVTEVTSLV